MELIEQFEAARPRLLSVAHRILGSAHDAEDAVQTTWLRTQTTADTARTPIANPDGWFTTITVRLCLDQLRSRERRGELPLLADAIPANQLAADEELLRRDDVSRALLVVLNRLTPSQRVAYVLHDLFGMPFDQVAAILQTGPTNAKKLASRARIRLQAPGSVGTAGSAERTAHAELVDAFLAAARAGDIAALLKVMAPNIVRIADLAILPEGAAAEARGARAVAEQTRHFTDRFRASVPMLVNGHPGAVIAPGGHPLAIIQFRIDDGRIAVVTISRVTPADAIEPLDSFGSIPGARSPSGAGGASGR